MIELNKIKSGDLIQGIIPNSIIEVIGVKLHGSDVLQLTYREYNKSESRPDDVMLFKENEKELEFYISEGNNIFNSDPIHFRLVSEAYRINLAYIFDNRLAVSISMVEPLPHQLTAVYENMRPLQPLRFCLADDPGAGKTIMAGLYLKEMMLREDVKRCLICAPGSLVEQWQDEMFQKFRLPFELMTKEKYETAVTGNPLDDNNFVITRLDQMSRNEEIQRKLINSRDWDLIIVDEAHKMSAHPFTDKIIKTKRYMLGEILAKNTKHLLLLTATPHNGKEEDFQAFLALLDQDRFEGVYREKSHGEKDYSGLMRRVVKEDMRKFNGEKLFPKRHAYTMKYNLSKSEQNLYDSVTNYVRNEFNKARRLSEGRQNVIGFALTVLQRRLASSPEAILQSLVNRKKRLQEVIETMKRIGTFQEILDTDDLYKLSFNDIDDIHEDDTEDERLRIEDQVVDRASAAQSIPELENEIQILEKLTLEARAVRDSGEDKKWSEVRKVIIDQDILSNPTGQRRKLIIFTEHLATLKYLVKNLQTLIGKKEAIVWIHGQMDRTQRKFSQNKFIHDKNVEILVATDAAGEGVNLQRANLMINYDMPWNLNRIEQRFGRIHRINQKEECYLWNLVADGTREGYVLGVLLDKLERQRKALGDKVYDVLGSMYEGTSLKKIILKAIIENNDPELEIKLKEELESPLDTEHIKELFQRYALVTDSIDTKEIEKVREELELAELRRLQPHFISSFFIEAFKDIGGIIRERESKRFEIMNVPALVRDKSKNRNDRQIIQQKYERIVFDKNIIDVEGKPHAEFICPGRPLLDSTLQIILETYEHLLKKGTKLIDPLDSSEEPYVMYYIINSIFDSTKDKNDNANIISKQMNFVSVKNKGDPFSSSDAAYLNFRPSTTSETQMISEKLKLDWIDDQLEEKCIGYANRFLVKDHLDRMRVHTEKIVEKIKTQVNERLTKEIIYQGNRVQQLREKEKKENKNLQTSSTKVLQNIEDLKKRLDARLKQLDNQKIIRAGQSTIIGRLLVIPAGFFAKHGINEIDYSVDGRKEIEKAAMDAVMGQERKLNRVPEDVTSQKLPYDIISRDTNGKLKYIEVKGKMKGKPTVTVSKGEILTYKNKPDDFILAIVLVDGDFNAEKPKYVFHAFELEPGIGAKGLEVGFNEVSVNYDLPKLLKKSENPR